MTGLSHYEVNTVKLGGIPSKSVIIPILKRGKKPRSNLELKVIPIFLGSKEDEFTQGCIAGVLVQHFLLLILFFQRTAVRMNPGREFSLIWAI